MASPLYMCFLLLCLVLHNGRDSVYVKRHLISSSMFVTTHDTIATRKNHDIVFSTDIAIQNEIHLVLFHFPSKMDDFRHSMRL